MRTDAHGNEYTAEDVLAPDELADYYDTKGINWRRRNVHPWTVPGAPEEGAA